ncbi:hypothetical protein OKW40_005686 [Paraburkholderia sp. RAU6.4a]
MTGPRMALLRKFEGPVATHVKLLTVLHDPVAVVGET